MTRRKIRKARFCEQCQRAFVPRRDDAKYCCGNCRNKAFYQRLKVLADRG